MAHGSVDDTVTRTWSLRCRYAEDDNDGCDEACDDCGDCTCRRVVRHSLHRRICVKCDLLRQEQEDERQAELDLEEWVVRHQHHIVHPY